MIVYQRRFLASVALLFSIASGCSTGDKPQPLSQAGFNGQTPRSEHLVTIDPLSRVDQPGQLDSSRAGMVGHAPFTDTDQGLSDIVQQNVKHPGDEFSTEPPTTHAFATSNPTTGQTTRPTTGASSGRYFEIGGVVMEVNGTPIYANKVVSLLDPVLAADAKLYDQSQFRIVAESRISKQIFELRDDQLEYAAAERHLDQKGKDMADALTLQWRMKQIAAAGGSLTVARQRAAARGEDFDDIVKQQYRTWMSRIYYEQKIIPQIQVSAADIREYYDAHLTTEFTTIGAARFRLIKVDPAKHGGRDAALQLITELRNRIAKAGESFESIARSVNDDPRWLKSGGDLGIPIQQHAFAIEPVDQAVWKTPVGEVTPVIEAGGAFYIALVEERTATEVHSFDDEAVQSKIDNELRTAQFRDLRQKVRDNLVQDAAVHSTPQMVNVAVEMAMQNYPRWATVQPTSQPASQPTTQATK